MLTPFILAPGSTPKGNQVGYREETVSELWVRTLQGLQPILLTCTWRMTLLPGTKGEPFCSLDQVDFVLNKTLCCVIKLHTAGNVKDLHAEGKPFFLSLVSVVLGSKPSAASPMPAKCCVLPSCGYGGLRNLWELLISLPTPVPNFCFPLSDKRKNSLFSF